MELYLKSIWMYIKSEMEYKLSFFLTMIASALSTFLSVFGTIFLVQKFGEVGGWSLNEIMLLSGIALFGHSATEMFLQGLNHLHLKVKSGILDQMLTRPRTMIFQVICSDFEANKVGRLVESVCLIVYGLITTNINWTLYKVFVFLLVLIGVNVLFAALLILKASFCFWTIEGMEFMNILQEGGRDLSSYPISIYKKWFAFIFTYIIPFGMTSYYPLVYLLDKQENAPFWYGFTPIFSIIFLVMMLLIWSKGLRGYKSTGS